MSKISGKPILIFVHQFSANGLNQWYNVAKKLSKDFDIIIPDLYYFGNSTRTDSICTLETQIDLIEKLIESIYESKKINLIGSSYGGIVSTAYSLRHPEKIDKLFISDSPILFFSLQKADSIARSLGSESTFELLCPQTAKQMKNSLKVEFDQPPPLPKFIRRQMVEVLILPNLEQKQQLLEELEISSRQFADIQISSLPETYLLWGEKDIFIPVQICHAIKRYWRLSDDHVFVFKNSGHAPNLEHPVKFAKVMKRSLKQSHY